MKTIIINKDDKALPLVEALKALTLFKEKEKELKVLEEKAKAAKILVKNHLAEIKAIEVNDNTYELQLQIEGRSFLVSSKDSKQTYLTLADIHKIIQDNSTEISEAVAKIPALEKGEQFPKTAPRNTFAVKDLTGDDKIINAVGNTSEF